MSIVAPSIKGSFTEAVESNYEGSGSISITKPSGASTGDIYVIGAAFYDSGADPVINTPSGFTQIEQTTFVNPNTTSSPDGVTLAVFAKIYDGTEGSTFTVTDTNGSNYRTLSAFVVQDADVSGGTIASALDGTPAAESVSDAGSDNLGAVTTTQTNSCAFAVLATCSAVISSDPSGWTLDDTADGDYVDTYHKNMASAGSTGTASWGTTGGTDEGLASITWAFKAAPIQFRTDPAIANLTPGTNNTLNPTTNPTSGDILVIPSGGAWTQGGQQNMSLINDSFGGTWTSEWYDYWASRRAFYVAVNDDWTTATGTVDIDQDDTSGYAQDLASGIVIVSGASSYTEDDTQSDWTGTSWTPSLTTGHDAYLVTIQMENNETISAPAGWVELGQVHDSDGLRTLAVFVYVGEPADLTPTFSWSTTAGFSGWTAYFDAVEGTPESLPPSIHIHRPRGGKIDSNYY